MKRRRPLRILGIALSLAGLLLPRDWYDALPRSFDLPAPPVKGVTLLQASLVLEGLALVWISFRRWSWRGLRPAERLPGGGAPREEPGGRRAHLLSLAAVTLLALALRLINLDSDLWLDEIVTVMNSMQGSFLHLITSYVSSNNHLLNSLLVKLVAAWAGPQEWAIRLPAALFGVATIPALSWVARPALSRRASLVAALLLAVSYHHIFFSQNARGYTAHLFFSVVASRLLVEGLQRDRARDWALYIAAMLGNFASMLHAGFVLGAHVLVGLGAILAVKRRGNSPVPLMRRLGAVFGMVAFLAFQLYALILPEAYLISRVVYTDPSVGFSLFSTEFLGEVTRGLTAGLSGPLRIALILGGLLSLAGLVTMLRRQWALAAALLLPPVLSGVYSIVSGVFVSPRLFLLGLPLAMLAVAQGLFDLAGLVADRLHRSRTTFAPTLATGLALAGSVVSLGSLSHYYSVPKQSYRSSIEYAESLRRPDDLVIVVHLAGAGYMFYGPRAGLREGENCFYVRSVAELERTLSEHPGRRSFLVTTFPRALSIAYPDLEARLSQGWVPARTFPATVSDGEISVWRPLPSASPR